MARKPKSRRVCHLPETVGFMPVPGGTDLAPITLTVDEYETIRLIDREGLSQEQCSQRMQVARTTAQKIYESARKKLANALVGGLPLHIEGGAYRLCDGQGALCGLQGCYKQKLAAGYGTSKGDHIMRIAVTYEDGQIFQHFGHTPAFKLYDTSNGSIVDTRVVSTNGSGHGALAEVLRGLSADVLICGGIGGGAQMALAEARIKLYGGVSGSADAAAQAFVSGQLDYDPNAKCDHHDHHGTEHTCGSHGCGEHSCREHT